MYRNPQLSAFSRIGSGKNCRTSVSESTFQKWRVVETPYNHRFDRSCRSTKGRIPACCLCHSERNGGISELLEGVRPLFGQELSQHEWQNPAVAIIIDLDRCIDAKLHW